MENRKISRVISAGAPGTGIGTQHKIMDILFPRRVISISTSDLVQGGMSDGGLVDDETVNQLLSQCLEEQGFFEEGSKALFLVEKMRRPDQVHNFAKMIRREGLSPDQVTFCRWHVNSVHALKRMKDRYSLNLAKHLKNPEGRHLRKDETEDIQETHATFQRRMVKWIEERKGIFAAMQDCADAGYAKIVDVRVNGGGPLETTGYFLKEVGWENPVEEESLLHHQNQILQGFLAQIFSTAKKNHSTS